MLYKFYFQLYPFLASLSSFLLKSRTKHNYVVARFSSRRRSCSFISKV